jgi:hypothetical protein
MNLFSEKFTDNSPRHFHEGLSTRAIEHQTAKIPSDLFLFAALGAMAGSAYFQSKGRHDTSTFIGQWAPALLTIGVYNKIVKLLGSD